MPDTYIQVGVTALRDPISGDYLPAVPLYVKSEDGAQEAEEKLIEDIGRLMASRMRRYIEGCEAADVSI